MLCWEEFVELRNLHERGWSVSAIARHLGKDRKTVRRYLADPDARPGVRKPTGKLIDPYAAYVQARLEDNPHLAGTVLDRELGGLGFAGSYRSLARHLAAVRPDCAACHGLEPAESVVMRHRPGGAQADWSPFYWTPAGSTVEVEVGAVRDPAVPPAAAVRAVLRAAKLGAPGRRAPGRVRLLRRRPDRGALRPHHPGVPAPLERADAGVRGLRRLLRLQAGAVRRSR
jgi:Helix-turn-helix domain